MNLHGYPVTAVVHANQLLLPIDRNPNGVHGRFPLLLVGRVHEDLAKDLVEARDVCYGYRCFRTPIGSGCVFLPADVGVRSEQDVPELCLFLVDFFDGLSRCSLGSGRCGYVGVRAGCKGSVLGAVLALWMREGEISRETQSVWVLERESAE
ncbi:hypothetical protein Vadar_018628 [Vaccinium darrowii]|uniref:Uncharacterized protein n=1 Tax=Vaccinium darrowii TaxID=229202 RepID=A0ACB7YXH1_9ERIC|nr:hypothetical protein Vadar_018628 [Vaccinium darrowii]